MFRATSFRLALQKPHPIYSEMTDYAGITQVRILQPTFSGCSTNDPDLVRRVTAQEQLSTWTPSQTYRPEAFVGAVGIIGVVHDVLHRSRIRDVGDRLACLRIPWYHAHSIAIWGTLVPATVECDVRSASVRVEFEVQRCGMGWKADLGGDSCARRARGAIGNGVTDFELGVERSWEH
jgi:hypothetical protein